MPVAPADGVRTISDLGDGPGLAPKAPRNASIDLSVSRIRRALARCLRSRGARRRRSLFPGWERRHTGTNRWPELLTKADAVPCAFQYGAQVPVLLIDGRKAFKYRLTESALEKRLIRRRFRPLIGGRTSKGSASSK